MLSGMLLLAPGSTALAAAPSPPPPLELWHWLAFGGLVLLLLAVDLVVFHRNPHDPSLRESALWTVVWCLLALAFNGFIWLWRGPKSGLEFLTGYLVEWSLSMDNVFVFAVIFRYFGVPLKYQYRVLYWGILGAILMRLSFILLGTAALSYFEGALWVFGLLLIFLGLKMAFKEDSDPQPEKNLLMRVARKLFPVATGTHGSRFFAREAVAPPRACEEMGLAPSEQASSPADTRGREVPVPIFSQAPSPPGAAGAEGPPAVEPFAGRTRLCITPLFLVLLVIESTDLVFAVDSVPAIFGITLDPFIVFTSNIFAILGLRALYFLLAGVMDLFRYLKYGLAGVLVFVGLKMVAKYWLHGWLEAHIPHQEALSLVVILLLLSVAVLASLLAHWRERTAAATGSVK